MYSSGNDGDEPEKLFSHSVVGVGCARSGAYFEPSSKNLLFAKNHRCNDVVGDYKLAEKSTINNNFGSQNNKLPVVDNTFFTGNHNRPVKLSGVNQFETMATHTANGSSTANGNNQQHYDGMEKELNEDAAWKRVKNNL